MARYIDAVKTADIISEKLNIPLGDLVDVFAEIPTADVVSTKAFEQVKWERDTAIEQLESYGVGFGEKKELVEVDKFSEQIIRNQAEVSDYWKKNVVSYRTMQGYSNIEHDTDNFLRGYNEAVEDMLAILGERKDT